MTAQIHENIIIDGKMDTMRSCPKIPEDNDSIIVLMEDEIAREIETKKIDSVVSSTACWRHYIATWEIKEDRLFLVKIVGRYRLKDSKPIFAQWFSGTLFVPRGELTRYVHMGFSSVYERELLITVEKGIVVEQKEIKGKDLDGYISEPPEL